VWEKGGGTTKARVASEATQCCLLPNGLEQERLVASIASGVPRPAAAGLADLVLFALHHSEGRCDALFAGQ
jgi:hypothetical protein